jgi:hypothetical protein
MKTCTREEVVCTECRWWDWAVGCAEDMEVDDPRAVRACRGFEPRAPSLAGLGVRVWGPAPRRVA